MRLVLAFNVGDGCTYSADVRLPFEYDSAEQAYVDLQRAIFAAQHEVLIKRDWRLADFTFAGHELRTSDFIIEGNLYMPDIWTIDEWFQHESKS